MRKWHLYEFEERPLLSYTCRLQDLYVSTFIDLERGTDYFNKSLSSGLRQVLFHTGSRILTGNEYIEAEEVTESDVFVKNPGFFHGLLSRYVIQNSKIQASGEEVYLCGIFSFDYVWKYSKISVVIVLMISVFLTVMCVVIFQNLKKLTLYPLRQITVAAELLETNQIEDFSAGAPQNIEELSKIHAALADLLKQKILLGEENTRKEYEIDHARLQYYQLQTRSHFFVNCLKSLYGMLENKEYVRMQRMILAFSNHLRYIFQDNLLLVTLKAELDEVNDYYNIVQLDRDTPILLSRTVDERLLEYKVPPLLIQTFLENSVKYNGKHRVLRCAVQIDEIELDGRRMMRIRFSDDGTGYSKEMLEKLNKNNDAVYEKEHVGISNLKRRIGLIYGSGYQTTFFNVPSGGACSLICVPLIK